MYFTFTFGANTTCGLLEILVFTPIIIICDKIDFDNFFQKILFSMELNSSI
jgi:hypothetical protein